MIIHNMPQRTPEWYAIRLGKITGTRLSQVFKSDNLTLIDELIAEQITGEAEPHFINAAMQWGIDHEDEAIAAYCALTGAIVEQVGFIQHDEHEWLGMSPDGLIRCDVAKDVFDKSIEVKCPATKTHIKYIRQNQVPNEYRGQVLASFLINKDQDVHDFVSFDPRFKVQPFFIYTTYRSEIEKELSDTMTSLLKFRDKWLKIYKEVIF